MFLGVFQQKFFGGNLDIQFIGVIAIGIAMLIAFMQKSDLQKERRKVPFLTKLAAAILIVVAIVDFYLWVSNQQTLTSFIQSYTSYLSGFFLMWLIFIIYWMKRGLEEALEVLFGILMGHFWWS